MKWKKLGKIFDPTDHSLPNACVEFAQSPQALVFDDFVRIYFSTRQKDATGKYLSHVAFVEMDTAFTRVLRVSDAPVVELGRLGCFDEHGIFPMNVVRVGDQVYGYTTGWNRRVSVSADASIGLAISDDGGLTFTKTGDGPVLTSSLHEPFLVGDGFVARYGSTFHMWYIHGTKWTAGDREHEPERVYKIAHATSDDGRSWTKEGRHLIADKLNADECQALPSVIEVGGLHHMFFCYRQAIDFRHNPRNAYRIGYATSTDLQHWIRDDERGGITVSEDGWDTEMQCYPHVFRCNGEVYLLYNGNQFGRFGFGLAVLEDDVRTA